MDVMGKRYLGNRGEHRVQSVEDGSRRSIREQKERLCAEYLLSDMTYRRDNSSTHSTPSSAGIRADPTWPFQSPAHPSSPLLASASPASLPLRSSAQTSLLGRCHLPTSAAGRPDNSDRNIRPSPPEKVTIDRAGSAPSGVEENEPMDDGRWF